MAHQRLASRVSLHPHPELETAMLSVKQIELKGGPMTLAGPFDSPRPAACVAMKSNSDTCCTAERTGLAVKISPSPHPR
jgi:hypothetical protein